RKVGPSGNVRMFGPGCPIMALVPRTPRAQLLLLAGGVVLAMSPWFATSAVIGELRVRWSIGTLEASLLVITVQVGFVLGAVASAVTGLADRVRPRRLVLVGALGAASANALVVVGDTFGSALVFRTLTGAFLALVYPSAMKAMSSWFAEGRGFALGVMIGGLTLGSALPHLVNALGGLAWEPTLLIISGLTLVGGLAIEVFGGPGPHLAPPAPFDAGRIRGVVANRSFRLASLGYFGHMWELYAMWAWVAAFSGDLVEGRAASAVAFAVIGVGALGSIHAGRVSDRVGRAYAARRAMELSGFVALFAGFLVDVPVPIVVAVLLVWGYAVVADSAQFSTIVSEVVPKDSVGTALTLQLAAGFVLSVVTIFLVPWLRDEFGWGVAFAALAPGPAVGVWAMRTLDGDQVLRRRSSKPNTAAPTTTKPITNT
ncbi:MAG: MFS transporter, partial [Actinomycetota bacterium]